MATLRSIFTKVLFFYTLFFSLPVDAQKTEPLVHIELGAADIAVNERFGISIISENKVINEVSKFPEIPGFRKVNRSSVTSTQAVEGQSTGIFSQRLTQYYEPLQQGQVTLKPFSIRVNGQSADSKGAVIRIGPAAEQPETADEQHEPVITSALPNLLENTERAFLVLQPNKTSVFTGEELQIGLYFYVAFADRNLLEFYNIQQQLPELLKKIKQPQVWEETADVFDIEPQPVLLDSVAYLRFRLHEASLFPLTAQDLRFPALALNMIRYRIPANTAHGAPARVSEIIQFRTEPFTIAVKPLPRHPLSGEVQTGKFKIKEQLIPAKARTGAPVQYQLLIEGQGNIAAIQAPKILWPAGMSAYPPQVSQEIIKGSGAIRGYKKYTYTLVVSEPSTYQFGKFIYWVYFNPQTAQYDTLQSTIKLQVSGYSNLNSKIAALPPDTYYQAIENLDNHLLSMLAFEQLKIYINMVLAGLFLIVLYLYFNQKP